ncbi:hypothetical protein VM1G_10293 [Cytospora mali]|uniref:Uncharacterized protein n=1 Tax=Cytospora mali TaxID=578113 RepID=A0A194VH71_CYTMA|nr:hypothetical protein VM1G_10293 [Valsa mali]
MPPALSKEFWASFRDPETCPDTTLGGQIPRSVDIYHDMDKLKNFTLTDKKIVVVGGQHAPPLSHGTLMQIMREGDKAWEGMSPRNVQMFHAFDHFMGGARAATLHQFGDVDHVQSFFEVQEGRNATGDVYATSLDHLSKHAEAITSQRLFKDTDVLVINYDFSVMIADGTTFNNFIRYMIGRVDRAITAIEALIKAAIPRMREGGRIIVLTNSLWALATTEASYNGNLLADKNHALTESLAQEVMDEHGIEVSFLVNRIVSDVRPIHWKSLCQDLNHFACKGYNLDMLRKVSTRVAVIAAFGKKDPTNQEESITYDRVLAAMLHTPCHWDAEKIKDKDFLQHHHAIYNCLADRYKAQHDGWNEPPGTPGVFFGSVTGLGKSLGLVLKAVRRGSKGIESCQSQCSDPMVPIDDHSEKTNKAHMPWVTEVLKEVPLAGKVAFVLDSGRHDGVTAKVCQELARLGAMIAFTYVDEDENRAKAEELVEKIRLGGGQAIALDGVPYRSGTYSDRENGQDSYIEQLAFRALQAFDAKQFHVIVNNVGCDYYSLRRKPLGGKKKLIYADSTRNMLALNYVVEVCAEYGLLANNSRVINLAGMGASPATAADGLPFWEHSYRFMSYWYRHLDDLVTFNTLVPCAVHDNIYKSRDLVKPEVWWTNVDCLAAEYRNPENVARTAEVVGWLARPTSRAHTMMVIPDLFPTGAEASYVWGRF